MIATLPLKEMSIEDKILTEALREREQNLSAGKDAFENWDSLKNKSGIR